MVGAQAHVNTDHHGRHKLTSRLKYQANFQTWAPMGTIYGNLVISTHGWPKTFTGATPPLANRRNQRLDTRRWTMGNEA